jgi:type II secretory pathway predicted ATPase ExeA
MALLEAGRLEPLFEDDAIEMLHQLAQGVPRQVVRLADFALLAGAVNGLRTIDAVTIEAAHDELAWPVEAVY